MNDERNAFQDRQAVKLERLELALKASNEGIWDWWIERVDIYYSRRILEFLECGTHHAPNLFLPPHTCIHPDDRPTFERTLARALEDSGPEILTVDARVQTGGGDWRWLSICGKIGRAHV